ncbi:hypothetical protein BCR34DRAFT_596843 [Clohesyomyces aquaticus]|uniref:Uncharacterized protein n=1 Tax=Clohesyomyces aquaticus TaxID=1231657 RepID=A0A1Y2A5T6_9PLEO|nr:hypothetical protein BCR34DRAFT_596843 [Clohesyomyces aquaticus]
MVQEEEYNTTKPPDPSQIREKPIYITETQSPRVCLTVIRIAQESMLYMDTPYPYIDDEEAYDKGAPDSSAPDSKKAFVMFLPEFYEDGGHAIGFSMINDFVPENRAFRLGSGETTMLLRPARMSNCVGMDWMWAPIRAAGRSWS